MNPHRRAGRPRKITIPTHTEGNYKRTQFSIQCFEGRHDECGGICQAPFFRGGVPCECACHKEKNT